MNVASSIAADTTHRAWGYSTALAPEGSARLVDPVAAGVIDDDRELQRCTQWIKDADGATTGITHLRLSGITCAACALPIESALRAVPGVHAAQVTAAAERATVRWDPQATRLSTILQAVRQAGYMAAPDGSADARLQRRQEARRVLWRWFVAAFCGMQVMMMLTPSYVSAPGELDGDMRRLLQWGAWTLTLPVMAFSVWPYFEGAWRAIRHRRIDMDVPVAVGLFVTFVAGTAAMVEPDGAFGHEVYFESIAMFATFLLGARWLETKVRHRAADWLEDALVRLPDVALRRVADGQVEPVAVHRLMRGDVVEVPLGEAFPADGKLLEGRTRADEALLTGESTPVDKRVGDAVVAGSINLGSSVVMEVQATGADTRQAAIVDMVRASMSHRPHAAQWADRWAAPFLWGVLALAAGAAAVWSVIDPSRAVWVAVSVLIVTCPCALSMAVPSALLAATGHLARRGVLLRRVGALEDLARVDVVMLDKTGTVTHETGSGLTLTNIDEGVLVTPAQARSALQAAAALASRSTHPVARGLCVAASMQARTDVSGVAWRQVNEVAGKGLSGLAADGREWRLGSWAWVHGNEAGAAVRFEHPEIRAWFGPVGEAQWMVREPLHDGALRPRVGGLVQRWRARGLEVVLISGDRQERVQATAEALGLTQAQGDATPQTKLKILKRIQAQGHKVLVIGDGVNDAPLMAQANASLAMGHGALVTRHHADGVILRDDLDTVDLAIQLAHRTVRMIRHNLWWAAFYNLACVPLAVMGMLPPWLAGLGMALSSLLVILNAQRLAR